MTMEPTSGRAAERNAVRERERRRRAMFLTVLDREGTPRPDADQWHRIEHIVRGGDWATTFVPDDDEDHLQASLAEWARRRLIASYGVDPDKPPTTKDGTQLVWTAPAGWCVEYHGTHAEIVPISDEDSYGADMPDDEPEPAPAKPNGKHAATVAAPPPPTGNLAPPGAPKAPDPTRRARLVPPGRQQPARAIPVNPDARIPGGSGAVGAWGLDRVASGAWRNNLKNTIKVLEQDGNLIGLVWFDEFLQRILTGTAPAQPTDSGNLTPGGAPREWTDVDDINLRYYLQNEIGLLDVTNETVHDAVVRVAHDRMRHCVRDWIATIEWDGIQRLEHFFPDHFGCEDSDYTRAVGRNFWISLAARIWEPGCKVDNMVVLEGEQGHRKSSALQAIGGAWFAEQHESVTSKDFYQVLQGKLLIEIGEMDSFTRGEVTKVKQVITCASDRYRPPYGRNAKDFPRSCVFIGTTNKDDWHRDETGARRFWPIRTRHIDTASIEAARGQLFAEATARWVAKESWWQMPDAPTKHEQAARFQEDVWHDAIATFVRQMPYTTTNEILDRALSIPLAKREATHQRRVSSTLRALGWKPAKRDGVAIWEPAKVATEEPGATVQ